MRLVRKEIAVARSSFGILIDRDNDRLDVLIAPTFSGSEIAHFLERLENSGKFCQSTVLTNGVERRCGRHSICLRGRCSTHTIANAAIIFHSRRDV
jgi:hypothetical protein